MSQHQSSAWRVEPFTRGKGKMHSHSTGYQSAVDPIRDHQCGERSVWGSLAWPCWIRCRGQRVGKCRGHVNDLGITGVGEDLTGAVAKRRCHQERRISDARSEGFQGQVDISTGTCRHQAQSPPHRPVGAQNSTARKQGPR
jgi:hypothetical protein